MRLLLSLALVALVACAASSRAPEPASSAPSTTACGALAKQAFARFEAVVGAHSACSTDDDCIAIGGASCFDHCGGAMARSGDGALRAIQADLEARECREFHAHGCMVEPPPCTPPTPARCHAGKCG